MFNLNHFIIPIKIKNDKDYLESIRKIFDNYCKEVIELKVVQEKEVFLEIREICKKIILIIESLINQEDKLNAEKMLIEIIQKYINNPFFVSELDKSYAFRGISPLQNFHDKGNEKIYKEMNSFRLSFYRARTKGYLETGEINELKDIVHLPYGMREKASSTRFSCKGVPCIYLGTTTCVCSKECKWDSGNSELFASAFVPNEKGKKLKILNLVISQSLINGICTLPEDRKSELRQKVKNSMLLFFPLVMATSATLEENSIEKVGTETTILRYLFSQLLMKVIKKMDIDGIAYLSMQGKDDFQYPYGVNLALPAFDITKEKPYSKYCDMFSITRPERISNQKKGYKESYINHIYGKYQCGLEKFIYSDFDNWLISQKMEKFFYD